MAMPNFPNIKLRFEGSNLIEDTCDPTSGGPVMSKIISLAGAKWEPDGRRGTKTTLTVRGKNYTVYKDAYTGAASVGEGTPTAFASLMTPEGLYGEYQKNYEEAKGANEARYQELKTGYGNLEGEMMGLTAGMGDTARARAADGRERQVGQGMQDLVTSGLYGTSMQQGVRSGAERVYNEAMGSIDEGVNAQKLGVLGNVRGNALGMIERRQDTYPDMGLLMQLAQMYGNYGGQSGGLFDTQGQLTGLNSRGGMSSTVPREMGVGQYSSSNYSGLGYDSGSHTPTRWWK